MEGQDSIYTAVMQLVDSLERDFDSDEYKIVECGIVVVIENETYTTARTFSSTDRSHIKRGMWEWALDNVKNGRPVE